MTGPISQEAIDSAVKTTNEVAAITIDDQASYENAGVALVKIKGVRKELKNTFQPIIDTQNTALKETRTQYKKYDEPLVAAEKAIKLGIAQYTEAQEAARLKEQKLLEAAAVKRAEDERLEQAAALEAAGDKDAAEAVIEKPITVAPVKVDNKPKVAGVSTKKIWRARVVDFPTLVQAVVDGKASFHLIEVSQSALNQMARAMESQMNVPGVQAYAETVVSSRS